MKYIVFSIAIIFCCCSKTKVLNIPETWPTPVYFGSSSLIINTNLDNTFLPKAYINTIGGNINKYALDINYYTSNNMLRLSLNYSYFPFKTGRYAITKSIAQPISGIINETLSTYGVLQGDAVENTYYVDSTKPCELIISRVDSTTMEFWGSFNGTYLLRLSNNVTATTPNEIRITNGTFHTKVL